MVTLTVPYCPEALALAEILMHSCHCHCRVVTDTHGKATRLAIEATRALVIPRALWNEAFAAPAAADQEYSDWDAQWLEWPLEIHGHIARFDAHVLMIEEALVIERETAGRA